MKTQTVRADEVVVGDTMQMTGSKSWRKLRYVGSVTWGFVPEGVTFGVMERHWEFNGNLYSFLPLDQLVTIKAREVE